MKKKKIILIGLLVLFGFFVFYLLIWLFFLFCNTIPSGKGLNKSDWLAFFGSYLGFAGTFALGFVTIFQNIKQREDNEKSENRMAELTMWANKIAERHMMLEYTPKILFARKCEIKFPLGQHKMNYSNETIKIDAYNKNTNELGSTSNQIILTTKIRSINNAIITGIGFSSLKISKQSIGEINLQCSDEYCCLIENNNQREMLISMYLSNIYDIVKTNEQNNEIIHGCIQIDGVLKMKNIYGDESKTPLMMIISWQMSSKEFKNNNLYDKVFTGHLNAIYKKEKNNG